MRDITYYTHWKSFSSFAYQYCYYLKLNWMNLIAVIVAIISTPVVRLRLHMVFFTYVTNWENVSIHSDWINSRLTTTDDQLWLLPLSVTSCSYFHVYQQYLFHSFRVTLKTDLRTLAQMGQEVRTNPKSSMQAYSPHFRQKSELRLLVKKWSGKKV